MEPTLAWLDLTAGDRDRMRRVLDLFTEQGTLDEMGIGSLRDTLSDALFPGTSYLQTRLRYALFIPWIYRALEGRLLGSAEVAAAARRAEIGLIGPLERSDDRAGIIGVQARESLVRLPSSIYWYALARWGIFRHPESRNWYHREFGRLPKGPAGGERADDPGVVETRQWNWHPRLPKAPGSFPWEASFALTPEEAGFLQGRFEEMCSGTLLAWLAQNGSDAPARSIWEDPAVGSAPNSIRQTVELARRFSLHVEGMPLLYNLLLAEERKRVRNEDDDGAIEKFRADTEAWADRETARDRFEPQLLWEFVTARGRRLPYLQRRFVERWSRRVAELNHQAVAQDPELRRLVEDRELQLKGPRARLANRNRLLDWRPGVGVGRLSFRWSRVRQLLVDLHQGLAA